MGDSVKLIEEFNYDIGFLTVQESTSYCNI